MEATYSVSDISILAYQAGKIIRTSLSMKTPHNNPSDADSEDSDTQKYGDKELDKIVTRRILFSKRSLCRNDEDHEYVQPISPPSPCSASSSVRQSSISLADMWEEVILV